MADERIEGRPYRDTVSLPGVLVMPGEPWPADFYARFPRAFRLPVRVTSRDEPAEEETAPGDAAPGPTATEQTDGNAIASSGDPSAVADATRAVSKAGVPAAPGKRGTGFVGAFLRVNGFLDRLMGKTGPVADGSPDRGSAHADPGRHDNGTAKRRLPGEVGGVAEDQRLRQGGLEVGRLHPAVPQEGEQPGRLGGIER